MDQLESISLRVASAARKCRIPAEYILRCSDILRYEMFPDINGKEHCEFHDDFKSFIIDFNNDILSHFEKKIVPKFDQLVSNLGLDSLSRVQDQLNYVSIYQRHRNRIVKDNRNLHIKGFFDEDSFVGNIPLIRAAKSFVVMERNRNLNQVPSSENSQRITSLEIPSYRNSDYDFQTSILKGSRREGYTLPVHAESSLTTNFCALDANLPEANSERVKKRNLPFDKSAIKVERKRNWNKHIMKEPKVTKNVANAESKEPNFKSGMYYLNKRCKEGKVSLEIDLDEPRKLGLSYPRNTTIGPGVDEKMLKYPLHDRYLELVNGDVNPEIINLVLGMKLEGSNHLVTENDIAGLESVKKLIKVKIVQPILKPHLHVGLFKAPKGILFFGPPGTGKTTIAKWMAHISRASFFEVSPSSITSKFHGESESIIKALFKVAEFDSPSIIFIDEVDAILGRRTTTEADSTLRMKNQLLQMMDGINNRDETIVVVAAATNRPDTLDDAALRRFSKRILIPLPDFETRKCFIFDTLNKNSNGGCKLTEDQLTHISNSTKGWNGSDLMALCSKAAEYSYDDTLEKYGGIDNISNIEAFRSIVIEDFMKALDNVHPSNCNNTETCENWDKLHGSH